jgi:AcrR family transcriptional regulator
MTLETNHTGLRERKRAALKARLVNAAIDLYLQRGYRETRIEDITAAADVSRRTFFHYFAAKDDVIAGWFAQQGEFLREAFLARPQNEPIWDALRESFRSLFQTFGVSEERAEGLRRLVYSEPDLFATKFEWYRQAAEALTPVVQRRLGRIAGARFTANVIVRAALAAHDVSAEAWATASRRGRRNTQLVKAFDLGRPAVLESLRTTRRRA